uniref:Protein CutA homolog n=1 Tax=Bos indicus x Bos taurus TaxID=30522 RepID=A0A4W2FB86_BOBOX
MKETGTDSDSEESEFTSESSKEEERKREGKMPPEEPVISGRGTEALTRSERSAKFINAELDVWNLTLELTLKRVEVPELHAERRESRGGFFQIAVHPLPSFAPASPSS